MTQAIRCRSLQQVRDQIDRLDNRIVELIAERTVYVLQAAEFKKTRKAVRVPDRIEYIIEKVRGQADQLGLDPDLIDSVYRHLIEQSIEGESQHWDAIQARSVK